MLEVFAIMVLVSVSTSLLGGVLVLREETLLADALSHSVLLGIVLGFFLGGSLSSPLLFLGATVFGLLTVFGIEKVQQKSIAYDAATGLVFSFFFALAVLLISLFARNVHLDMDVVLLGEVIFAPLNRLDFLGLSLPKSLVQSACLALVNGLVIFLTFGRLSVYLFDPEQAGLMGLRTGWLRWFLMSLVSLTIVLSFESLGAIAVIALLVGPALSARLWSRNLASFFLLSLLYGLVDVSLAFALAQWMDLTLAGTGAVVTLLVFGVSLGVNKIIIKFH